MQRHIQNGFTLIELLIAIAIVAILAGIAIPAYQDSIVKSRRADAKSALLELSVFMEKQYTALGCYNPGSDKDCTPPNGDAAAPTLPFITTPKSGKANYNMTVVATDNTFTLTATPIKATASSPSPDPKCDSLTLTNTGIKSTSEADKISDTTAKSKLIGECW